MFVFFLGAYASTLAVLPFDNRTGDAIHDGLGSAVADMMITDLAEVDDLTLVERARIRSVLQEQELVKAGFVSRKNAVKAGRGLGAERLVLGSIISAEPELRIDARVVDVADHTVVHTASVRGPKERFFELEQDLVLRMLEGLDVAVSARTAMAIGRTETESYTAFIAYGKGVRALDLGELDAAREAFSSALLSDAGFTLASDAMQSIEDEIDTANATRATEFSAATQQMLEVLATHEGGLRTAFATDIESIHMQAHALRPSERRAIVQKVLALGLPDDLPLSNTTINEWALHELVSTSGALRDGPTVLAAGPEYVERFPTGVHFSLVTMHLRAVLDVAEAEKRANDENAVEAILAETHYEDARDRCKLAQAPGPRAQVCMAWLKAAIQQEEADDLEFRRAFEYARVASDPDMLQEILTLAETHGIEAERVARMRDVVKGWSERAKVHDDLVRKADSGRSYQVKRVVTALVEDGAFAEADALVKRSFKRFGEHHDILDAAAEIAFRRADLAALRALEDRASAIDERLPFRADDLEESAGRLAAAKRELHESRADAFDDIDLDERAARELEAALLEPGDPEQRAALMEETARTWLRVPKPAALARAIELRESIMTTVPKSERAEMAKRWLESAPR